MNKRERIDFLLSRPQVTYTELAREIGVTRQAISNMATRAGLPPRKQGRPMTPNTRLEGETYEDYRKRLRAHNRELRASMKGIKVWESRDENGNGLTYRKDRHGELPKRHNGGAENGHTRSIAK